MKIRPKLQGIYLLTSPSNKIYVGSAKNLYKRLIIDYPRYEKIENKNCPWI